MAGGRVAPLVVNKWLLDLRDWPGGNWGALMTSDPFQTSDPLSVEILGDAYRRPRLTLELVDIVLRPAIAVSWAGIPAMSRVAGIAGFDAPFNGNPLWYCERDDPLDFPAGGSYTIGRGELFVGVDS